MSQQEFLLKFNGDYTLGFSSNDEITSFVHSELKYWGWLRSLPDELIPAGNKLFEVLVENCWRTVIEQQVEQSSVSERREYNAFNSVPVILSSSVEAQLIEAIRERFGSISGFMAMVFINAGNRHAMIENQIIKDAVEIPGFEYQRVAAIQTILAFQNSDLVIANAHIESMKSKYQAFDKSHEDVMGKLAANVDLFNQHIDRLKKGAHNLASREEFRMNRRVRLWLGIVKRASADAKATMETAKSDLGSAEAAYKAQIDLSDSVKHWEDRRAYHQTHKTGWLIGVVLSMLMTFLSIVLYFKYGGMVEMSGVSLSDGSKDISAAVTQVFGALLLLTLVGIMVRIALRQFNTHSQLAMESQERVIFTKTYLTLMRDGKLNSDLDKKLVLESLFRPSQAIGGAEITFSPPMELIYKAISEQRK